MIEKNHVVIFLCTFNGSLYLEEQLNSLGDQTHLNWRLIVSDDGSSDSTVEILKHYQKKWGYSKLEIREGPKQGFCKNFLSLASDTSIKADYYCFCDQDDVWLEKKIEIALQAAKASEDTLKPFLYCGRTKYVDESLVPFSESPLFDRPKSFRNSLVQSVAGGNTMLFNNKTKAILEFAGTVKVASHDWWIYQIVTGLDGVVCYDLQPQILYRQHSNALIGGNSTISAKVFRFKRLLNGQLKEWFDQSLISLETIQELLSKENQILLIEFKKFREDSFIKQVNAILTNKFYRQTKFGNISLILACLLKKC